MMKNSTTQAVLLVLVMADLYYVYTLLNAGNGGSVDIPAQDSSSGLGDLAGSIYSGTIGAALAATSPQSVSQAGLDMIAGFEGFQSTAYPDAGSYSIGYGHKPATAGQTISQQQALDYLAADAGSSASYVLSRCDVTTVISQNQLDALTDWIYNCGDGKASSSAIWGAMNAGDWQTVCDTLLLWCNSQGQYNGALFARRSAEVNLIQNGVYA